MPQRRALYHHRTQGRDVEAVHIRGLIRGLEEEGVPVELVGPPGITLEPELADGPIVGGQGSNGHRSLPTRVLGWLARRMPQLGFELLEIGYNAVAFPRLCHRMRGGARHRPCFLYERYALYNAAGALAAALFRVPLVLEVNETVSVDRNRQGHALTMPWLAARFEEWIFRRATGVVVVSEFLREQVVARGVAPERVRVTPNAVDTRRFDPERADRGAVRHHFGLHGSDVVGFVGSFAKWHGVDLLVRAAARLAPTHPRLMLLLVGDGTLRSEAEALAAQLGIEDRVVFTGRQPHERVPDYIAAMDICVMPASNVFGSPMKVFEYLAMGKPVIAPRLGPLEEAIEDGRTGRLFPPGELEGLCTALEELLANPALRAQLGQAGREEVRRRRQWRHNARHVLDLVAGGAPTEGDAAPTRRMAPVRQSEG